jgi:hypothetical protein
MTVYFKYTDHLESIHPETSVFVEYSVMADVTPIHEDDGTVDYSVKFTSVRYKARTLLNDGEFEPLNMPLCFGNNRERNEVLALFTNLAIEKYESEKIERWNQTA